MKAKEVLHQIRDAARATAAGARVTEISAALVRPGLHVRQGDVLLVAVAPDAEHGDEIGERQLAPGTTQGSRHVAEGDARLYAPADPSPLVGPLLVVGEGGCVIVHPEHRHYRLPPETAWQVRYEQDLAAEEVARARD
jgi:hypothetical protein